MCIAHTHWDAKEGVQGACCAGAEGVGQEYRCVHVAMIEQGEVEYEGKVMVDADLDLDWDADVES